MQHPLSVHSDREWTTTNELAWLAALGTHLSSTNQHRTPRAELLRLYLVAPRHDWGQVRRSLCFTYAREALALIEQEREG